MDRILTLGDSSIETELTIPPDLELLRGHYPDYPIMPAVLLCEAIFQSGALLVAELLGRQPAARPDKVPVLTRINGAKFKRQVQPGDTVVIHVRLQEHLGQAWFMKGKLAVGGRTAVSVEFACALAEPARRDPSISPRETGEPRLRRRRKQERKTYVIFRCCR